MLEVEKLDGAVGEKVELPVVMTADNGAVTVGADCKAKATAEIVAHGKGKKIIVFKYKAKKNEHKKKGHRQQFSSIKIVSIA